MLLGTCVAGVIGLKTPRYLLFGTTVDMTAKMESSGEKMKIHVSSTTHQLIQHNPKFKVEHREGFVMKGMEEPNTYWLYESSVEQE